MKIPPPIVSTETPREAWTTYGQDLPIRGGWGYCREDACIIDKNDPIVDPNEEFDWISVEYDFIEYRIIEEMGAAPWEYLDDEWKMRLQSLIYDEDRRFDRIVVEVSALELEDWKELKAEWTGSNGHGSPGFGPEAHWKKREGKRIRFEREFWFDITSFFGKDFIS